MGSTHCHSLEGHAVTNMLAKKGSHYIATTAPPKPLVALLSIAPTFTAGLLFNVKAEFRSELPKFSGRDRSIWSLVLRDAQAPS
jgi:hypothetical protein